ncbi:ROK family transcriptional regulator [Glycomyces dulcitolivorans]|uniref:ROK family transcriptional regulator n=1 Tax=Glycomyces dulcitolivorans TaxID=2200759 RepID=UPI000DD34433|nr:ROK family transcriptional regulator [Glycomyces dulcitolivorans]
MTDRNDTTTRRTPAPPGDRAGANQSDLGSFNEATIVETIRQAGAISRVEIAERTGLTQQSVSRILRILLERGLLVENASERAERLGKPRTPVRLRAEAAHAVGALVDPELVSIVLTDLDGTPLQRRRIPVEHGTSPEALVEIIAAATEDAVTSSGIDRSTFLGVGVAAPGPITTDGELLDLPLSKEWRNVPLRAMLAERLDCPVVLEKDGAAAAVGERWVGRTDRASDFVYLYVGTGVGSGLVLNGETYRGASANAGEFGQLCAVRSGRIDHDGRPQLVRECNPTAALPEIARELGYAGPAVTYQEMCAEVGAGDPAATAAARQIADVVALGAVALIDLLDLPLLVVGGPAFAPEIEAITLDAIDKAVNTMPTARHARHVAVERSLVKVEAGAIGAASTIFHASFAPSVRRTRRYGL